MEMKEIAKFKGIMYSVLWMWMNVNWWKNKVKKLRPQKMMKNSSKNIKNKSELKFHDLKMQKNMKSSRSSKIIQHNRIKFSSQHVPTFDKTLKIWKKIRKHLFNLILFTFYAVFVSHRQQQKQAGKQNE